MQHFDATGGLKIGKCVHAHVSKRNLITLFLFQESFKINDVISPVFINKFCEELEACSASVIDDLAAALDLAETFQNFRCGFEVLFCGVFS